LGQTQRELAGISQEQSAKMGQNIEPISRHSHSCNRMEAPHRPSPKSRTVLVIDDEEAILDIIRGMLEYRNFRVFTAQTHEQGMTLWEEEQGRFDIVIMDINLSTEGEGLDFAQELRVARPETKIVFMSGVPLESFKNPSLVTGYNFLQKPFVFEQLMQAMTKHLYF
jgi:two-component system, cell cycle sensor histidine kinase and response regulator CckA